MATMNNRRRFSRGCPAVLRRSSKVATMPCKDDYTTTLSALTVSVIAPNQVHIAVKDDPPPAADGFVYLGPCADVSRTSRRAKHSPFIRRRSRRSVEYHEFRHQGYVTSLSFDGKGDSDDPLFHQGGHVPHTKGAQVVTSGSPGLEETSAESSFAGSSEDATVQTFASRVDVVVHSCDPAACQKPSTSFMAFRLNYLVVTTAIMLADGLQGTHLYVLYEGYGYSVASLYCLGFVTGAVTMPLTGPLVDRFGRKKSALIYCALEIFINMLEQYPFLSGLIASRMIGGVTTNLLSSVFETWLDTEYRRQGFDQEKYEIVMRDSVVAGNLAAIASGYFAHELAERRGLEGPFEGAVGFTILALVIVMGMWTENYGSVEPGVKSVTSHLVDALSSFKADSKLLRVGIIQGCTAGSVQIFIFLWSPALRELARTAPTTSLGLDAQGEPAYGLIFGAFMFAGVLGGLLAPLVRQGMTVLLSPPGRPSEDAIEVEGEGKVRPMAVEFLAAFCYMLCAALLLIPCLVPPGGTVSFSLALGAFLTFELIVGIYMPCEGVIRSIYIPSLSRCSLLTLPRIIVNVAVAVGVISTNVVSLTTAFYAVSGLMAFSAALQLSLVSTREWASLFGRMDKLKKRAVRSMSFTNAETSVYSDRAIRRTKSSPPKVLHERLGSLASFDDHSLDEDSFEKKTQ